MDVHGHHNRFPVAVVGIGCRLPGGVTNPREFWDVLVKGRDMVTEVPSDRWAIESYYDSDQTNHSKMITKRCGLINDIDMFDNAFFKISPREAASMDPQQRHALEVTYEAFQDAGIVPDTLGESCGVFMGVGMMDYPIMICNTELMNPYTHTGIAHSSIANRISYVFDLRGPSLAVDTACAASMNAMHLACTAMWDGECSIAVAGACNGILLPDMTVGFSALGVLSPDGMSCPFSDTAKGYVRSEGFGSLILKPLDDALANGDHIYSVIRGSAVAANGANKSITMPSAEAQEMVMRNVYNRFNIPMSSVGYVEAHGTGTPVGDPIEAEAIGATFGPERQTPLKIGSVKSNFGHNECAAGLVAAIKVCLMLKHKRLVPTINFNEINPAIDLKKLNLQVQTNIEGFQDGSKPYIMGLNNFGFVGAIAHMVFQEPPTPVSKSVDRCGWSFRSEEMSEGNPIVIPLSAKSQEALQELATKWTSFSCSHDALSVSSWQATRQEHHQYRLGVIANSSKSFRNILSSYTQGEGSVSLIAGTANQTKPKICFVFPGMGQQWVDMGRTLFREEEVFRDSLLECDSIFKKVSGWSILEACDLFEDNNNNSNSSIPAAKANALIYISQPAIFFIQVGIYKLWKHWGVEADAVVGHSLGESAAAYVCGGLTLHEAITVIYHRSREQAKLTGTGRMAALRASAKQAKEICNQRKGVYISAVNGPGDVTLGGDTDNIEALVAENPGKAKQLRVTCPFHTPVMDPIRKPFEESMKGVVSTEPGKRDIAFYSTVTGHCYQGAFDTQYWWKNIRNPVLFQPAIEEILQDTDIDVFVEVSGAATLLAGVKKIIRSLGVQRSISTVFSGLRGKDDLHSIQRALCSLYVAGVDINWSNVTKNAAQWAPVPTYPWQHKSFWSEREDAKKRRLGLDDRSFKGQRGNISVADFPYLADHQLDTQMVFPRAGYVEYLAEMNFEEGECPAMANIGFTNVLTWPEDGHNIRAILALNQTKAGENVQVECDNTVHCTAIISRKSDREIKSVAIPEILKRCVKEVTRDEFCSRMQRAGFQHGPAFQVVEKALMGDGESLAYLTPVTDTNQRFSVPHLDATFQLAQVTAGIHTSMYLPVHIENLYLTNPSLQAGETLLVHTQILDCDSQYLSANITFARESGTILAEVKGYKGQRFDDNKTNVDIDTCMYTTKWQPMSACTPSPKIIEDVFSESHLNTTYADEMDAIRRAGEVTDDIKGICASYIRNALETVPEEKREKRKCYNAYMSCYKSIASSATVKDIPYAQISETITRITTHCPELHTEMNFIKNLGDILPDTLRDYMSAMPIMFSAEEGIINYLYDSLSTRIYFKAVAEAITEVVNEGLKHKSVIRIFEMGGRLGGLTRFVLEPLKDLGMSHQLEYVFTDFSAVHFSHAENNLAEYPFIQYKPYDIEREGSEQGFVPGSFDIVISLDSLHGSLDVHRCTRYMSHLLAPNGLMFIIEGTNTYLMPEMSMLPLDVCWAFEDFRKKAPGICWLNQQGWADVMRNIGLQEVTCASTPNEFFHSVIVGRAVKTDIFTNGNILNVNPSKLLLVQDIDSTFKEEMRLTYNGSINIKPFSATKISQYLSNGNLSAPTDVIYIYGDADNKLHSLLKFLQIVEQHPDNIKRVWVLSGSTNKDSPDPNVSLAVGMVRAFSNHLPNVPILSLDFDATCSPMETLQAMMNLMEEEHLSEREMIIRNGILYVPRIVQKQLETSMKISNTWRVEQAIPENRTDGSFDDLAFHDVNSTDIPSGHVKISIRAAPLNNKDIMMYMGLLDASYPDVNPYFGLECAGVVEELGTSVSNLKVGDEVIAFGQKCFASHVICNAQLTTLKPQNLNWTESASIGMVFVTAYFSLVERAHVKPTETILIHSACGGVGLAAIQISRMLGAKIICTAGSNRKRKFLRNVLGVEFVSDSRSTQFYDDVMSFTEGRGVDVVLNSLSGNLLSTSMSVLAPGGRFCEVGKQDIPQNSHLSINVMKLLLENKNFMSCQVDLLMQQSVSTVHQLMKKIVNLFENDTLHPIPSTVYSMGSVAEAFGVMSEGSHTGKIVFDIDGFIPDEVKPALQQFPSRATYIVTGGFGGIGQALTRWLCDNGAEHIVLVSRSSRQSAAARRMIKYIEGKGVSVYQYHINIADYQSIKCMLESLREDKTVPPIKGVFHLAGVFEDGNFSNLTVEEMDQILGAKASGASYLHILTKEDDLDVFFLLSSVMALWGNPSQPASSAANNYLDSLANHRHSEGLPALSIQLGPIQGAGHLEDREDIVKNLKKSGNLPIRVDEFLQILGKLLRQKDQSVVCLANQNWQVTRQYCHKSMLKFNHLTTIKKKSDKADGSMGKEDMEEGMKSKMADILCMPVDAIDVNQPMINYGVDSLVAIEMVAWTTSQFGLTVSQEDILGGITTAALLKKATEGASEN